MYKTYCKDGIVLNKELESIQECLKAALDYRVSLRKEYVERDKALAEEIKGYLIRIRQITEENANKDNILSGTETETRIHSQGSKKDQEIEVAQKTRRRQNYNYKVEIVPKVLEILRSHGDKMTQKQLFEILAKKYDLYFANRTVAMNRILTQAPEITKENGFCFLQEQ